VWWVLVLRVLHLHSKESKSKQASDSGLELRSERASHWRRVSHLDRVLRSERVSHSEQVSEVPLG
jgi:hypothetical protein